MIVLTCDQRSAEWRQARLGRLTSSKADAMLATIKSGEAAGRRNLRVQLVLERLTQRPQENGYVSAAMQQGNEREPDARDLYEAEAGVILRTVGFVCHDSLMAGASPDAVIGEFEGLVEFKCPEPSAHLEFIRSGVLPAKYLNQITHQLWVTGAAWCDFVSFNPDFPAGLQFKAVRVPAVREAIDVYAEKAKVFLAEVDRELEALATIGNLKAQLAAAV